MLAILFEDRETLRREFYENISKGGVFVQTEENLDLRSQVELTIGFAFCNDVVRLAGEVVHSIPPELSSAGATPGVALQLENTVLELRELFEPFLGEDAKAPAGGAADASAREARSARRGRTRRRSGRERRDSPRHMARILATVRTASGDPIEGRTRDVSESGMLFSISGDAPEIGARVVVTLDNPISGESLEIPAMVARHVASEAGVVAAVGIRFSPSKTSVERTREFLQRLQGAAHSRRLGGIHGEISELGLGHLLQSFGLTTPNGTITMMRGADEGYVAFSDRMIVAARLGRVRGEKALTRLLAWSSGHFEFHAWVDPELSQDPPLPLEATLLNAARLLDEERHGATPMVDPEVCFSVDAQAAADAAGDLDKLEAAIVDLFSVGANLRRVLDVIPEPDGRIHEAIDSLQSRGIIVAVL